MTTPPRFYPILDPALVLKRGLDPLEVADALLSAGASWLQFRHKGPFGSRDFRLAERVGQLVRQKDATFVMNDRVDVALMLGADGVHMGQDDLPPAEARKLVGDRMFIGFSTHNQAQLEAADDEPVDYLALGPLYRTSSKENPDPVVGVEELRRIRALTEKPLVAIGGITRQNVPQVLASGADSAAVISDFLGDDWRAAIAEWSSLER